MVLLTLCVRISSALQIQIADLTLENGLFASFDFVVRQQLNPIWHKTGPKTRQLVADLRILNNLLMYVCGLAHYQGHELSSLATYPFPNSSAASLRIMSSNYLL